MMRAVSDDARADGPEHNAPVPEARVPALRLAIASTVLLFVLFMVVSSTAMLLNPGFGVWFSEVFVFFGFTFVLVRLSGRDPARWTGLALPRPSTALFGFAVGAANFFALAIPLQFVAQLLFPHEWTELFDSSRIFAEQSPADLVLIVSGVLVAAPVAEEFFFRGVLQNALEEAGVRTWAAIGIAAVIFSGFHFDPVGFVARAELGVVFGWMFHRTRSIWPGVLAHAANNGITTVAYFATGGQQAPHPAGDLTSEDALQVGLWMIVGLIALAGLALVARRFRVLEPQPKPERALPYRGFYALAAPWVVVAVLSIAALVIFDKRGIQLTFIDSAHPIPERIEEQNPAELEALKDLRRRARSGEVSIDEYKRARQMLIDRYSKPGPRLPAPTRPPPTTPSP